MNPVLGFNTRFLHKYLPKRPYNPLNDSESIKLIGNSVPFPEAPEDVDMYGWLYQPSTKTVKLNSKGTDLQGVAYFDY